MGNPVIVHLIRHEQTKGNIERRYIGWTDQSIVIEKAHCVVPIHATDVFGSDLKRCRETAKLYFPNAQYHPFSGLREMNFGDFEMKTYNDLKEKEIYWRWINSPEQATPPNGESFADFKNRVLDCFKKIIHESGEYVFIVHGGVIRLILSQYTRKSFQEVLVRHRNIYTLYWDDLERLKGGQECSRLSEAPITVNGNL